MAQENYFNTNPNLHVSYLLGQLNIGELLLTRAVKDGDADKIHKLLLELNKIETLINTK